MNLHNVSAVAVSLAGVYQVGTRLRNVLRSFGVGISESKTAAKELDVRCHRNNETENTARGRSPPEAETDFDTLFQGRTSRVNGVRERCKTLIPVRQIARVTEDFDRSGGLAMNTEDLHEDTFNKTSRL